MNPVKRLFSNPEKVRLTGMVVIGTGLLAMMATIHFVWWPWMTRIAALSYQEGENWCDYRLSSVIDDNLRAIWVNHSMTLLELEKRHVVKPLTPNDLQQLVSLPGVKDAFYINLGDSSGFQIYNLVPLDSLKRKLDDRSKKSTGGRSLHGRTLIGGLNKFRTVESATGSYPILARYVGTYYSNRATEIIGIILDQDWYIEQIPTRLDSLARDNQVIAFMSPYAPDTLDPSQDPYACPNGDWKQTLGVVHGNDTLWWYGDRSARKKVLNGGPMSYDDRFDVKIYSITEFLLYPNEIKNRIKVFTWIEWLVEFNILLLLTLLGYGFYSSRRQSRRNQIALGHLAHSVKTPVARLQLAADILEEGQVSSPDEERKVIQTVSGECRQLRRAVENAALTMEGGKIVIHKEPGDLAGLVRETTEAWRQSFDQVGIRLVVEGVEKPLRASFDRDKLHLALDNLIDNALRHTYLNLKNLKPGQAFVTLSVHHEETKISVSVTDSGAGIPQADMKNVFKRFSRSSKDPLTGVSGLGLGLALVKEIVEGHGGKVRVEQKERGGSKFIVNLTPKEV